MSATQSFLSSPQYGYDFVVATTQASINATLKAFLSALKEPVATVCYVADTQGNPTEIDYPTLVANAKGSDPFAVPATADPATNQDLKNLLAARFMMGFKAQIGLPPGLAPANIPDLVILGSDTSAVTFNLLCSQFTVVQLDPGSGYAPASWMNLAQPAGQPWIFTSKVDLRLAPTDQGAYTKLPPAVQAQIKTLGGSAFSVQQLLFDLDNAALESIPHIEGVTAGTKLYTALEQYFVGKYFTTMQQQGQPLLGCAITQSNAPASTLTLTDLDLHVDPFLGTDGQPVLQPTPDQQSLATLNYLCAANGHTLPPAVRFAWNWLDPNEESDYDGVIATNRNALVAYFQTALLPVAVGNCFKPSVRVWVDGLYVKYSTGMTSYQRPSVSTPATGQDVLEFSYSASDEDQAGVNGALGREKLSTSFDLKVTFSGNTITVVQHLVVYLYVKSLATSGDGNIIDKTITDTYTLSVTESGQLTAQLTSSVPVDNSKDPRTNGFLNFWTGLNDIIESISNWSRGFVGTNLKDIPIKVLQGFVFPGGRTFAFKNVYFSGNQDLVTHITYTDPT